MTNKTSVDKSELELLIGRIVDEFAARTNRGEQPSIKEYIGRHPEIADPLRRVLPTVQAMCELSDASESPVRGEPLPASRMLGEYRIVREIGRGGMGVVYEAEQLSLGRPVALKVLPFAAMVDNRQLQRFKTEAQAAALLHHPNIVPIHSVGCDRGVHYYAMQYIEGQTLAEVIAELRQLEKRGERRAESRGRRAKPQRSV